MKFKGKICVALLGIIFVGAIAYFCISHKTYHKYNDYKVIGHSLEEIKTKYGKFDEEYPNFKRVGYYIYTENSGPMPSHAPMYYWIEYDENNIAVEVYVAGPVGG